MKSRSAAKLRTLKATVCTEFVCRDHEIGSVVLREVPRVRGELVFHLFDELFWTIHTHACIATQADSQQVIETGEVIHVGMRDEKVTHSQKLAGRQSRNVT